MEAEPVLVEAAGRLDPPRLRRALGHLQQVADPDGADRDTERRQQRRGLWVASTWEGMVAVEGLLEPEAGQSLLAALEPLARPAGAADTRSGSQRRADALAELARRSLEGGRLPQAGGVRPQLTVTIDLDSLVGRPGAVGVGGEPGGACRRLACDGALTRVLVSRHRSDQHHHPTHGSNGAEHHPTHNSSGEALHPSLDPSGEQQSVAPDPSGDQQPVAYDPSEMGGLGGRLRAALALLPPVLGGAPTQPLEVGRTSRVIQPAHGPPWPGATAAGCSPAVGGRWAG